MGDNPNFQYEMGPVQLQDREVSVSPIYVNRLGLLSLPIDTILSLFLRLTTSECELKCGGWISSARIH